MSLNSTYYNWTLLVNVIDTKVCLYPLGPNCVPHCLPCKYTLHNKFLSSLLRLSAVFCPTTPFSPYFNKAGLLAWVHTCHFPCMLQAGWGSRPTLAFTYTRVEMHLTRWLIHTLQGVSLPPLLRYSLSLGCVAATLIASICRVCRCHPCCVTHYH